MMTTCWILLCGTAVGVHPQLVGHIHEPRAVVSEEAVQRAILIGDDIAALVKELQAIFPEAALRATDDDRLIGRVVGLVEDPSGTVNLRLDIRGTPFQQKVWKALPKIPAGTTMSYGALAKKIGLPKAVRAVGHANGSNPISVVVPCHRLIGANGSLIKYGGGLQRKRWLLKHEGVEV